MNSKRSAGLELSLRQKLQDVIVVNCQCFHRKPTYAAIQFARSPDVKLVEPGRGSEANMLIYSNTFFAETER